LSITYNTVEGDTFDNVARKKYGTADSGLIRAANPAVAEPIPTGTTLVIPDQPSAPKDQTAGTAAANPDELAVIVNGEAFKYWSSVSVLRTVDQMDTFTLSAPTTDVFKPLSFSLISVSIGGAPLFTGTVLNVQPTVGAYRQADDVDGYSLPGVLNDCTMPVSAYPVEFNDQTLRAIANKVLLPFGLAATFEGDPGATFDRVAMSEGEKVLTFLAKLAKQRGLVVGSSPTGALVFSAPSAGIPVARLEQGSAPLVSVLPQFNPQDYYSDVTGIEPAILGLEGQTHTVKNTRLSSVLRPFTYIVDDTGQGDLKAAVEAKAARMFGGAVTYSANVTGWRDSRGDLWEPGATVQLNAPAAKVFGFYSFMIRAVTFRAGNGGRDATLELVLPDVFSGKIPGSMPWDG
jgi:prophage tail gpP-like protein/phage tail protein X